MVKSDNEIGKSYYILRFGMSQADSAYGPLNKISFDAYLKIKENDYVVRATTLVH
jgi:hypothetical protein